MTMGTANVISTLQSQYVEYLEDVTKWILYSYPQNACFKDLTPAERALK